MCKPLGRGNEQPRSSRQDATALPFPKEPTATVFWPRDLLPYDCPDARILTWGYNTMITNRHSAANQDDIFAHAKNLLFTLQREHTKDKDRRLIFVAHSLGGIIVKEALRRSQDATEPAIHGIVESTSGIVFLGTPHGGSASFATVGDVIRRIASTILRMDTNPAILRALGLHSPELELGRESFIALWRLYDFNVKTFQEALPLTGVNVGLLNEKVVPKQSSSLGDPRERAETIEANHMNMCRFYGADDPRYNQLRGELKNLVEEISATTRAVVQQGTDASQADLHACLSSLKYADMALRQLSIHSPMKDTCNWLFADKTYLNWYHRRDADSHQGLLWIKGKPGSGKSTLMKEALRRTSVDAEAEDKLLMSYFFNARGGELEYSALGLFLSLVLQIVDNDWRAQAKILKMYVEKRASTAQTVAWHQAELEGFLADCLSHQSIEQRIEIYIDALDECDEPEARRVVDFFRELSSSAFAHGSNLNVCFSSRHYPNISVPDCPEVIVEQRNKDDIERYVQTTLRRTHASYQTSLQEIAVTVIQKASGVFLWVVIVLQMLREDADRGSPWEMMQRRLDDIPTKMADLFAELFKNLNMKDREEALQMWRLVICTPFRMHLVELHEAISFDRTGRASKYSFGAQYYWVNDELHRTRLRLLYLSRGLLEVVSSDEENSLDGSVVQPVHETVKEFFADKGFLLFGVNTHRDAIGQGHFVLSKLYFHYLCSEKVGHSRTDTHLHINKRKWPLLAYACDWPSYARKADILGFVASYLLDGSDLWKAGLVREWKKVEDPSVPKRKLPTCARHDTILSFLCAQHLFSTATHLIQRPDFRVHEMDSRGHTPLHNVCGEADWELGQQLERLLHLIQRTKVDGKQHHPDVSRFPIRMIRLGPTWPGWCLNIVEDRLEMSQSQKLSPKLDAELDVTAAEVAEVMGRALCHQQGRNLDSKLDVKALDMEEVLKEALCWEQERKVDSELDAKAATLAEILMRKGADPRAIAQDRRSPVDIAKSRGMKQTLKVLTRTSTATDLSSLPTDSLVEPLSRELAGLAEPAAAVGKFIPDLALEQQ
ncbi:hypothetical protein EDD37DRAFT_200318 [Exophiala viscosa]|uniref:uncharacterized protein n=1 Tax=Exophiala viscosa TaxID=2486360 RepID=UPI00219416D2|nr:hypothetical protein EDD37DRAFT_200318 [Exophiala viscosa]